MESFFLSETLKYFYLLFTPSHFIFEENYVFTTEAHPFPILKDADYITFGKPMDQSRTQAFADKYYNQPVEPFAYDPLRLQKQCNVTEWRKHIKSGSAEWWKWQSYMTGEFPNAKHVAMPHIRSDQFGSFDFKEEQKTSYFGYLTPYVISNPFGPEFCEDASLLEPIVKPPEPTVQKDSETIVKTPDSTSSKLKDIARVLEVQPTCPSEEYDSP
jgi:hypothetical protein